VPAIHKPIVRAAGFPDPTVPAVFLDGRRLQGTARIARALDALVPEPPLGTFLGDAKLGIPTDLALLTAAPVVWLAARVNRVSDHSLRRDLAGMAGWLDKVDGLIVEGVLGGDEPNAADYQIATSVRLLLTLHDLRPDIETRPAGELAVSLVPEFPRRIPAVFGAMPTSRAG
jgi:glutathione S-transferase